MAHIGLQLHIISLGFIKASLLLQLTRFAPSQRMKLMIWSIFAFSGLFTLGGWLAMLFICQPMSYFWEKVDPTKNAKGSCGNFSKTMDITAVISILTDAIVWLLPLKFIWRMRLPAKRQKAGLMAVFVAGGL